MKKYHIGYTCGVFDLFHTGHLNLLERCKELCDVLVVGVCNDEYVRIIKKVEPVYSEADRLRIIKALKCVDDAVLVDIETTNYLPLKCSVLMCFFPEMIGRDPTDIDRQKNSLQH